MERLVRLLTTAAVGLLPAGALWAGAQVGSGRVWMIAASALVTAGLVAGWPALTRLPEPHSARLTLAFTGTVAIVLAIRQADAAAVLVAVALGFPAVFVRELTRPAPRLELVRSIAATTAGVVAVAAVGLWVSAAGM
ncbi:MAG: hypothetical protein LBU05_00720, partial [Bifidobacteriaceae bacterium]|nr:hypothetical protein [Bifidobacteriaceae bacterium]